MLDICAKRVFMMVNMNNFFPTWSKPQKGRKITNLQDQRRKSLNSDLHSNKKLYILKFEFGVMVHGPKENKLTVHITSNTFALPFIVGLSLTKSIWGITLFFNCIIWSYFLCWLASSFDICISWGHMADLEIIYNGVTNHKYSK